MLNPQVSNPNDFRVVIFKNTHDFDFTPDLGCMYDSRPIFGKSGRGISAGESMTLPYHVGHRLAVNLAKNAMIRGVSDKPQLDAQGQPIIKAIWDSVKLDEMTASYLTDLYTEERPIAQSETDRLLARVDELQRLVMDKVGNAPTAPVEPPIEPQVVASAPKTDPTVPPVVPSATEPQAPSAPKVYQDKAEVIAELEKRNIPHDKRSNKATLEKLLA